MCCHLRKHRQAERSRPVVLALTTELGLAEAELVAGWPERAARKAIRIAERASAQGYHETALRAYLVAARATPNQTLTASLEAAAAHCDFPVAALHVQYAAALAKSDSKVLDQVSQAYQSVGLVLIAGEAAAWSERRYRSEALTSSANRVGQRATAILQNAEVKRPMHWPRSDIQDLTARELEVARLIATGMKPQGVAQDLKLSRRTVENHLLRCYRKLGINSHVELGTILDVSQGIYRPA